MKHLIKELNEKPMDRQQFMKHLGIGILGIIGISSLIKNLLSFSSGSDSSASPKDSHYGL